MTNSRFALLALVICAAIAVVAYALRPEPIAATGGSFTPRDELIHLNDN
jgi:Mn2+/Fe2+ NRAMP family transporter